MVLACISFSYSGRRSINRFKVWANCWSGYSANTCFNNAWQLVSGQFYCNGFNNCVILPGFFENIESFVWWILVAAFLTRRCLQRQTAGLSSLCKGRWGCLSLTRCGIGWAKAQPYTIPITNTLSTKAISPKRFIILPYGLYWNWLITGKWSDKSQVINTGSAAERRMRTSLRACIGWRWLLDDTT